MDADLVRALSEKMVTFLQTGTIPEGLFRPDIFLDLTMPTWRVQAAGAEELIAERKQGHPGPGKVTRWRADPTPTGFVFEERWGPRGPAVVLAGDDARGSGRRQDSRAHRLLHW